MNKRKLTAIAILLATVTSIVTPSLTHAATASTEKKQKFMESGVGRNIATKHRDSKGYTIGYTYKILATSDIITVEYNDGVTAYINYSTGKLDGVTSSTEPVDEGEWKDAEISTPFKFQDGATANGIVEGEVNKVSKDKNDDDAEDTDNVDPSTSSYLDEETELKKAKEFIKSSEGKRIIKETHDGNWEWSRYEGDNYLYVRWEDGFEASIDYNTHEVLNTESAEERAEKKDKKVTKRIKTYLESGKGKSLLESRKDGKGKDAKYTWTSPLRNNDNRQLLIYVTFDDGYKMTIDYRSNTVIDETPSESSSAEGVDQEVTTVNLGESPKLEESSVPTPGSLPSQSEEELEAEARAYMEDSSNKETILALCYDTDSNIDTNAPKPDSFTYTIKGRDNNGYIVNIEYPNVNRLVVFDFITKKVLSRASSVYDIDSEDNLSNKKNSFFDNILETLGVTAKGSKEGDIEKKERLADKAEEYEQFKKDCDSFMQGDGNTLAMQYVGEDGNTPEYSYTTDVLRNQIILKYSDDHLVCIDFKTKQIIKDTGKTPIVYNPNIGTTNVNGYDVPNYIMIASNDALNEREIYMKEHGDPTVYDRQKYPIADTDIKVTASGKERKKHPEGKVSTWYKGRYYDNEGYNVLGWQLIDGIYYHFNETGELDRGPLEINGKKYLLSSIDGAMCTGWQIVNDKYYYYNTDGSMKTGWIQQGKLWYHLADTGEVDIGWFTDDGKTYHSNNKGVLQTGWIKEDGKYYYLGDDGVLRTSNFEVNGKVYTPDSNGVCFTE